MISVTILTKNSDKTLRATLESLKSFSEVIILDTGSLDTTLEIARSFSNVKIFQKKFTGFGTTHNLATSLARNDWILSIDSDEVLTDALLLEIRNLKLDPDRVYSLNRHNYFNGKLIKGCGGWYPDPVIRLYNRKATHFSDDAVHEKILLKGLKLQALSSPLNHYPYREMSDFLAKMQTYTNLFANQSSKRSSLGKAILHSVHAFIKSYVLKRGFLDGKEGFIISMYNSHTAFYKYLKLWEKMENR